MSATIPEKLEVWVHQTPGKLVTYRILKIDRASGEFAVIDMFSKKAAPRLLRLEDVAALIELKKWERVEKEPFWWLVWPSDQLFTRGSEEERARKLSGAEKTRDRSLRIVEIVLRRCGERVMDGTIRAAIVRRLAKLLHCHPDSIEGRVRRYWQGGANSNALLSLTFLRGGPGKARITDLSPDEVTQRKREKRRAYYLRRVGSKEIKRTRAYRLRLPADVTLMRDFARHHVLKKGGMSWRRGYRELIALHFSRPVIDHRNSHRREPLPIGEYPSFGQFFRIGGGGITDEEKSKLQLGSRGHLLQGRPLGGVANLGAKGPGAQFEIDMTIADVVLLDRTRTFAIGRPVLYLVVDTWSQAIVGYTVTLENASYVTAVQALARTVQDKAELARELGIEPFVDEDWSMHHLSGRILADNGELRGLRANLLVKNLKIDVKNARSKRPDDKPFVEGAFHSTDCRSIRWLSGATRGKGYGDQPASDSAELTLDDFDKLMFISCVQANHRELPEFPQPPAMLKEGKVPTPAWVWQWGLKNICGDVGAPPSQLTRINLLLHTTGKYCGGGLELFGMMYDCPEGKLRQTKIAARRGATVSVPVAYDSRRIGKVWIRPMGGADEVIELRLNERWAAFADWSLDELEWRNKMMRPSKSETRQAELAIYSTLSPVAQAILGNAKKAAAINRRTRAERNAADAKTHEMRAAEKESRRDEDLGVKPSASAENPSEEPKPKPPSVGYKGAYLKILQGLGPKK